MYDEDEPLVELDDFRSSKGNDIVVKKCAGMLVINVIILISIGVSFVLILTLLLSPLLQLKSLINSLQTKVDNTLNTNMLFLQKQISSLTANTNSSFYSMNQTLANVQDQISILTDVICTIFKKC